MIEKLLGYIKNTNSRTLPKWERFNQDMINRQSIQMLRFLNVELPDTPNVVLLEQMIKVYIDEVKDLIFVKDNFSRCISLLEPKRRLFMEQRIDSIRAQSHFVKTFVYGQGSDSTIESVIPVIFNDPLKDLPLQPWEQANWTDLNPVRLWYMDSNEFISNLVPDARPRYLHDIPSISIITVDFLLLTLKLLNYIDVNQLEGASHISIRNFLRDEVFFHQYADLREMWTLKFIEQILDCEDEAAVIELGKRYKDNRFTLQDYGPYSLELYGFLQDMKLGGIDPVLLLNAKLLGDKSILDRTREGISHLSPRNMRQYDHLTLSINIMNMKVVIKFLSHSRNASLKKSIAYEMGRELNLLIRTGVHKQYRNKVLSAWLQQELRDVSFLLNLLD